MPPNVGDGPVSTLEQMRDILAEILSVQRQNDEGRETEGSQEAEPEKPRREPGDRERLNEQKDRTKSVFDAGVGVLGSIGGAPAQLAALMRQADQIGKSVLEFGQSVSNWWSPPKKDGGEEGRKPPTIPVPEPVKPPPVPVIPEWLKVREEQPAPPAIATPQQAQQQPGIPTPLVSPAPTLTPQPAPRIPEPAMPDLQPVRQPDMPLLPTKLELAPVAPHPLPGQPTDVDTRLPEAEKAISAPIGQTAPVLIPGAPGGQSGSADVQDSARLAAVLERLVVFLDKADKRDGDTAGKDGDETEQGENFQRRSMWKQDHTHGGGSGSGSPIVPPTPTASGTNEQKAEALKPAMGAANTIGAVVRSIAARFGS